MFAAIRLVREKQVNTRVIPTINAIEESVELAHEILNRVFRKVPGPAIGSAANECKEAGARGTRR